jgi:hypothetical protein
MADQTPELHPEGVEHRERGTPVRPLPGGLDRLLARGGIALDRLAMILLGRDRFADMPGPTKTLTLGERYPVPARRMGPRPVRSALGDAYRRGRAAAPSCRPADMIQELP